MNVLIIDCYDSFTYNLAQQVGKLGANPVILKNDSPEEALSVDEYERIILSPGPGRPEYSGLALTALDTLGREIPTLGVCLGHQAICHYYGAKVQRAPHLMHGKTSEITHDGEGIFRNVPEPFKATRYHSLIAVPETIPKELIISATSLDDGYIMSVRHKTYPVTGVQFHPESFLTSAGDSMIKNFVRGRE